jgi:nitrite reductase/ring-hydroxylating ferredoxin subunit
MLSSLTAPFTAAPKTFKIAKVSDLKDGQMKEVEIPGADGKVLLSRVKGNFYATGAKCTRTYTRTDYADEQTMAHH